MEAASSKEDVIICLMNGKTLKKCGAIKGSAFFQLRNMIFITIFINTYENLGLSEYLFFQPDTRRRCG